MSGASGMLEPLVAKHLHPFYAFARTTTFSRFRFQCIDKNPVITKSSKIATDPGRDAGGSMISISFSNSFSTSRSCSRRHISLLSRVWTARENVFRMASMQSDKPSVVPSALCLFAPTRTELQTAQEALKPFDSILDAQSQPVELSFCDAATDVTLPLKGSDFKAASYYTFLNTTRLGRLLLTTNSTASTQSFLQQNVANLPDGVVFVADQQSGGKGRGGNVWQSPKGCLMFSALTRLDVSGQRLPFVQYLVTLAIVKALQEEVRLVLGLRPSHEPALDIRIKWPNDVYAKRGSMKMGGVLCNSSFRQGKFHLILGVGLNLLNKHPTTCLDSLIKEEKGTEIGMDSMPICSERVLATILNNLEPMLDRLCTDGFAPFEQEYYDLWLHTGQTVEVEGVKMKIIGLSGQGYLLARDECLNNQHNEHELHPDGNSLDFFKGLIRKKAAI
jgi:biotin--protein ligase